MSKNTLHYAYEVDSQFGQYPILGSLGRALGKGWKVLVVSHKKHFALYQQLQSLLRNPSQLDIIGEKNFSSKLDKNNYDLVLVDSPASLPKPKDSHSMWIQTHAAFDEFDLISAFSVTSIKENGVIAITGTGKGKTTTALGIGIERLVEGEKVGVIQWFKEKKSGDLTWAINEHQFPQLLLDPLQLQFFPMGLGFFGSPNLDRVKGEQAYQQHRAKAQEGLRLAEKMILEGEFEVIILDELIDTVKEIAQNIEYPLIDLQQLQQFLRKVTSQNNVEIIVTGRRVTDDWEKYIKASYIITEVKHPWSYKKQGALSGLDF